MGKIFEFFARHPFMKGAVAYGVMWPSASILQQYRNPKRNKIDFLEAARFGAVGVAFVLPVFYTWIRAINWLVPAQDKKTIFRKVILEQTLYWPISLSAFFAGMNFFAGRSVEQFQTELKQKYVKTHLTGLCFWPFVSPFINYSNLIKDHNRAPAAAAASFLWATFLSYISDSKTKEDTTKLPERLFHDP